jgi:hypothetical protein
MKSEESRNVLHPSKKKHDVLEIVGKIIKKVKYLDYSIY